MSSQNPENKTPSTLPPPITEDFEPQTPLLPKADPTKPIPSRHHLQILTCAQSLKTQIAKTKITILPNHNSIEIIDSENKLLPIIETTEQKYTWLNQTIISHFQLAIKKLKSPYSLELENITTFKVKTNLQNKLNDKISQSTSPIDKIFLSDLIYWQTEITKINWNNLHNLENLLNFYKTEMLIETLTPKP